MMGIEEALLKKIYKEHVKQLKNLDDPHKKLLICFSGIAGSGKTYIAKILEERYLGVRIRSDDIRGIVRKLDKGNVDQITYGYLEWLFNNYPFKNQLIILDQGIDRRYEEIFSRFKKKKYGIFIIRVKVPEKVYERRLINKIGKLDDNYLNRIDDWKKQFRKFGKNVKSDIIIKNKKDNELKLDALFKKLDGLVN